MSFVSAEILREVVGPQAAELAGFGVNYEVKSGANIDPGSGAVVAELNEQSLARAQAQGESGENREVAKTLAPEPKAGGALAAATHRNDHADNLYQSMLAKRGLMPSIERGMSRMSALGSRRFDHRAALSKETTAKNPLLRIKQRHLLRLRQTFNEISKFKKKTLALRPENLPQAVQNKMDEDSVMKGDRVTPSGKPVPAVKTAGYNPREWARWGHALDGVILPPKPRSC